MVLENYWRAATDVNATASRSGIDWRRRRRRSRRRSRRNCSCSFSLNRWCWIGATAYHQRSRSVSAKINDVHIVTEYIHIHSPASVDQLTDWIEHTVYSIYR